MERLDEIVDNAGKIARKVIEGNTKKGVFQTGTEHFLDLWTRDFCYAANGMIALGMYEEVEASLEKILSYQRENGQLPTTIGHPYKFLRHVPLVRNLLKRGVEVGHYRKGFFHALHLVHNLVPWSRPSNVFDSNTLATITCGEYAGFSDEGELPEERRAFLERNYGKLKKAVAWSLAQDQDGDCLLEEHGIGTWANSIIKNGKVLYTNVLLAAALERLSYISGVLGNHEDQVKYLDMAQAVSHEINERMWMEDRGYYTDWFDKGDYQEHFSMDGNALAIMFGVADEERGSRIEKFVLDSGITFPIPSKGIYPRLEHPDITIWYGIGGIGDYHINKAWIWLGCADAVAKIRLGMLDEAKEEIERMAQTIVEHNGVYEIYDPPLRKPTKTLVYNAEPNFSWSSGMFLYAVNEYNKALRRQKPAA